MSDRAPDEPKKASKTNDWGWHRLRGLMAAQCFGAFNDNVWKQLVIFLPLAAPAVGQAEAQAHTSIAQIVLLVPLMIVSLPAGALADRASKRSVIVWMKVLELLLILAGTAVLALEPHGGRLALLVLCSLGIQAALFSPSKYGIIRNTSRRNAFSPQPVSRVPSLRIALRTELATRDCNLLNPVALRPTRCPATRPVRAPLF